jgi:hypothetical protein
MRFKFRNAHGQPCCEGDDINLLCDHCKAQARRAVRQNPTDLGRRSAELRTASAPPSTIQQHLDAAHFALGKGGAHCAAFAAAHPTAAAARLTGAKGARHSADDQAAFDNAHDHIVAAGAQCAAMSTDIPADIDEENPEEGSPKLATNARLLLKNADIRSQFARRVTRPVPNGYRAAAKPLVLTPDLDPHYHPFGAAPDGYAIGLAARKASKEVA